MEARITFHHESPAYYHDIAVTQRQGSPLLWDMIDTQTDRAIGAADYLSRIVAKLERVLYRAANADLLAQALASADDAYAEMVRKDEELNARYRAAVA